MESVSECGLSSQHLNGVTLTELSCARDASPPFQSYCTEYSTSQIIDLKKLEEGRVLLTVVLFCPTPPSPKISQHLFYLSSRVASTVAGTACLCKLTADGRGGDLKPVLRIRIRDPVPF
jgi:hypothetical protein